MKLKLKDKEGKTMKKYIKPSLNIENIELLNVITTSTQYSDTFFDGTNNNGPEIDFEDEWGEFFD